MDIKGDHVASYYSIKESNTKNNNGFDINLNEISNQLPLNNYDLISINSNSLIKSNTNVNDAKSKFVAWTFQMNKYSKKPMHKNYKDQSKKSIRSNHDKNDFIISDMLNTQIKDDKTQIINNMLYTAKIYDDKNLIKTHIKTKSNDGNLKIFPEVNSNNNSNNTTAISNKNLGRISLNINDLNDNKFETQPHWYKTTTTTKNNMITNTLESPLYTTNNNFMSKSNNYLKVGYISHPRSPKISTHNIIPASFEQKNQVICSIPKKKTNELSLYKRIKIHEISEKSNTCNVKKKVRSSSEFDLSLYEFFRSGRQEGPLNIRKQSLFDFETNELSSKNNEEPPIHKQITCDLNNNHLGNSGAFRGLEGELEASQKSQKMEHYISKVQEISSQNPLYIKTNEAKRIFSPKTAFDIPSTKTNLRNGEMKNMTNSKGNHIFFQESNAPGFIQESLHDPNEKIGESNSQINILKNDNTINYKGQNSSIAQKELDSRIEKLFKDNTNIPEPQLNTNQSQKLRTSTQEFIDIYTDKIDTPTVKSIKIINHDHIPNRNQHIPSLAKESIIFKSRRGSIHANQIISINIDEILTKNRNSNPFSRESSVIIKDENISKPILPSSILSPNDQNTILLRKKSTLNLARTPSQVNRDKDIKFDDRAKDSDHMLTPTQDIVSNSGQELIHDHRTGGDTYDNKIKSPLNIELDDHRLAQTHVLDSNEKLQTSVIDKRISPKYIIDKANISLHNDIISPTEKSNHGYKEEEAKVNLATNSNDNYKIECNNHKRDNQLEQIMIISNQDLKNKVDNESLNEDRAIIPTCNMIIITKEKTQLDPNKEFNIDNKERLSNDHIKEEDVNIDKNIKIINEDLNRIKIIKSMILTKERKYNDNDRLVETLGNNPNTCIEIFNKDIMKTKDNIHNNRYYETHEIKPNVEEELIHPNEEISSNTIKSTQLPESRINPDILLDIEKIGLTVASSNQLIPIQKIDLSFTRATHYNKSLDFNKAIDPIMNDIKSCLNPGIDIPETNQFFLKKLNEMVSISIKKIVIPQNNNDFMEYIENKVKDISPLQSKILDEDYSPKIDNLGGFKDFLRFTSSGGYSYGDIESDRPLINKQFSLGSVKKKELLVNAISIGDEIKDCGIASDNKFKFFSKDDIENIQHDQENHSFSYIIPGIDTIDKYSHIFMGNEQTINNFTWQKCDKYLSKNDSNNEFFNYFEAMIINKYPFIISEYYKNIQTYENSLIKKSNTIFLKKSTFNIPNIHNNINNLTKQAKIPLESIIINEVQVSNRLIKAYEHDKIINHQVNHHYHYHYHDDNQHDQHVHQHHHGNHHEQHAHQQHNDHDHDQNHLLEHIKQEYINDDDYENEYDSVSSSSSSSHQVIKLNDQKTILEPKNLKGNWNNDIHIVKSPIITKLNDPIKKLLDVFDKLSYEQLSLKEYPIYLIHQHDITHTTIHHINNHMKDINIKNIVYMAKQIQQEYQQLLIGKYECMIVLSNSYCQKNQIYERSGKLMIIQEPYHKISNVDEISSPTIMNLEKYSSNNDNEQNKSIKQSIIIDNSRVKESPIRQLLLEKNDNPNDAKQIEDKDLIKDKAKLSYSTNRIDHNKNEENNKDKDNKKSIMISPKSNLNNNNDIIQHFINQDNNIKHDINNNIHNYQYKELTNFLNLNIESPYNRLNSDQKFTNELRIFNPKNTIDIDNQIPNSNIPHQSKLHRATTTLINLNRFKNGVNCDISKINRSNTNNVIRSKTRASSYFHCVNTMLDKKYTNISTKYNTHSMEKLAVLMRTHKIELQKKQALDIKEKMFYTVMQNRLSELDELFSKHPTYDIDTQDQEGNTLLLLACKCGSIDIVNYLISKGADINIQNNEGNSSLHIALQYLHYHVADRLIVAGISENITNKAGKKPWDICKRYQEFE